MYIKQNQYCSIGYTYFISDRIQSELKKDSKYILKFPPYVIFKPAK